MLASVMVSPELLAAVDVGAWLDNTLAFAKVLIGFSVIVFVHELGHFLTAKWCDVKVERFAVGFGPRICGYRPGEGFTFGNPPALKADELRERGWSETDYCLRILPFGGYVKMLGEDDIIIDEKTGDVSLTDDPRAFTNRPVGQRMLITSAGVIFNVIFAALLFMVIFLVGHQMVAPVLGDLGPTSQAARAGLEPGDRILSIDGHPVDSFQDIRYAEITSGGPMQVEVERDGVPLPEPVRVEPTRIAEVGIWTAGFQPATTMKIVAEPAGLAVPTKLQPRDVVTAVNGVPVESPRDVEMALRLAQGAAVSLTVERPQGDARDAPTETVTISQRPMLAVLPERVTTDPLAIRESAHILGFHRRQQVGRVLEDRPADAAGFQPGDVVLEWGTVATPRFSEITEIIQWRSSDPIRVLVARCGVQEPVKLTVKPRRPVSLFGAGRATVGIAFQEEVTTPVVADIDPDSPAAALALPRGARLLGITPPSPRPWFHRRTALETSVAVRDWFDVIQLLEMHAGQTVTLHYQAGNLVQAGEFAIPSSIVNELDLPPDAVIQSVAGVTETKVNDGQPTPIDAPWALRKHLEMLVGQTVDVTYVRESRPDADPVTVPFTVTADNTDPWQLRIRYEFPLFGEPRTETVTAHGNPLKAMWMGAKVTYWKAVQIYTLLKLMFTGEVGISSLSGPVGVISVAVDQAKVGFVDLLFFLAYLSINLAILNFLPIPVVDGGVMLFLIIEKVRGAPLSLKTQMISSVVGLGLILLLFVVVTFQDILRLIS